MGESLAELRSSLLAGLLLAGVMYIILAVTGLYGKIRGLFTPIVNGTFLILMPLSISATVVSGIINKEPQSYPGLVSALVAMAAIVIISLKARGYLKSISILCGIIVGWAVAFLLGVESEIIIESKFFSLPESLAWGRPSFNYGMILSSMVTGILLLSNHVTSIHNMFQLMKKEARNSDYNRSLLMTGLANISAEPSGVLLVLYPLYLRSGL